MGKLIKVVLLLVVIAVGVAVLYSYSEVEETADAIKEARDKEGGIQPQEKYGFAPMGVTEGL